MAGGTMLRSLICCGRGLAINCSRSRSMRSISITPKASAQGGEADIGSEAVKEMSKSSKIFVWSKSWCPMCSQVKQLFSAMQVPNEDWTVVELDQRKDGEAMQAALAELTSRTTVPNVFIGGENVGGCDEVVELWQEGKLDALFEQHSIPYKKLS